MFSALFGAVWGSFLGVLVARAPSDGGFGGRSRCDACRAHLGPLDLIPIVSWLWRRARCRRCDATITWKWTALEMATALLFATTWTVLGSGWQAVIMAPFLGVLIALSIIDLDCHRLPNSIVYPTGLVALVTVIGGSLSGAPLSLIGGVAGGLCFGGLLLLIAVASGGGMGMGDAKLATVIGFLVGALDLSSVAVAIGGAILVGGLAGVVALLRGASRRSAIPFGPMLAAGAFIAVLWGPDIVRFYVSFLMT